jgi:hypothetical protein
MTITTYGIDVYAILENTVSNQSLYHFFNNSILSTTAAHSYKPTWRALLKYPTFEDHKTPLPDKCEYILRYNFAFAAGIEKEGCEKVMNELVEVARKLYDEDCVKGWSEIDGGEKPEYAWAREEGVEEKMTEYVIEIVKE